MTPRALSLFLAFRAVNWLTLDGAVNVRDLGGLPLQGGGSTRAGVLVRADNLQGLSARDLEVTGRVSSEEV